MMNRSQAVGIVEEMRLKTARALKLKRPEDISLDDLGQTVIAAETLARSAQETAARAIAGALIRRANLKKET